MATCSPTPLVVAPPAALPRPCPCRRWPPVRRGRPHRPRRATLSPSRSASAPVVITRWPSLRPLEDLDALAVGEAGLDLDELARSGSRRGTRRACRRGPRPRCAARSSASGRRSTVSRTRAYMPGLRRKPGFGTSISICAVRVAGSNTGATRLTWPVNSSPGNVSTVTIAGHARRSPCGSPFPPGCRPCGRCRCRRPTG